MYTDLDPVCIASDGQLWMVANALIDYLSNAAQSGTYQAYIHTYIHEKS